MARETYQSGDALHFGLWLIFDKCGNVRLTRREPSLCRDERAVSLSAVLPLALWRTPSLSAKLTIEADGTPNVNIDMVAASVREAVGVDIDLRINEASE